ncbi:MAG TPA: hypothetical protein VGE43_19400 [Acidimicrobiales bacterium]
MAGQLAGIDFVYAREAIYDRTPGVERCIYGAGDIVPMPEAIRLGLVEAPAAPPADPPPRGRRSGARSRKGPVENRAHTPSEDR